MASLRVQGTWRRYEDPGMAVDEADYGRGKGETMGDGKGLIGDDIAFVTAQEDEEEEEVGGQEGAEWTEEKWELRAMHIRRTEVTKRATAPRSLTEQSVTEVFDVLASALTRNKAQLFPTRRRPKLCTIEAADSPAVDQWFQNSGITIGNGLTAEQQIKAVRLLYTWRDVFETDLLRI